MLTRLSVGDGVGLALAEAAGELACCVAPAVGELAADVDVPAVGWAGGWARRVLAERGGERVRAAARREHHDDREHDEQAPPAAPRSGGPAGGPGETGEGRRGRDNRVSRAERVRRGERAATDAGSLAAWAGAAVHRLGRLPGRSRRRYGRPAVPAGTRRRTGRSGRGRLDAGDLGATSMRVRSLGEPATRRPPRVTPDRRRRTGESLNSAPQPPQNREVSLRCRPQLAQKLITARPIPVVTRPTLD